MNISPDALKRAREEAELSQRELARRVAALDPDAGSEGALQVRLSRIERGQTRELPHELAEAVAVALGFEDQDPRHLAESNRWEWATSTGYPISVPLGFRRLLFQSPERAYDARDLVASEMSGEHPWRGAVLHTLPLSERYSINESYPDNLVGAPIPPQEVGAFVVDDPSDDELRELALCERALQGSNGAGGVFVGRAVAGELLTLIGPDVLLEVAMRRANQDDPHPTEQQQQKEWQRELKALQTLAREYLQLRLARLGST